MQATSRSTFSRTFISLLLALAFIIPLLAPLSTRAVIVSPSEKASNSKEFSQWLSMKPATQEPESRSGELLVRFRAGLAQQDKDTVLAAHGTRRKKHLRFLQNRYHQFFRGRTLCEYQYF